MVESIQEKPNGEREGVTSPKELKRTPTDKLWGGRFGRKRLSEIL